MRIVFAGTPEFAARPLGALLAAGFPVCGVLTQPDRPVGRGRKLQPSPVRQLALEHQIAHATPLSLRDPEAQANLAAWQPDLIVVIAYGMLLPAEVLALPRLGCVNVHASLLPRWRGAAPIQRALEAGDEATGICLMQMDVGLDTGPVLARAELLIRPDDTAGSLHDHLATLTEQRLPPWLHALESGELKPVSQPDVGVTYAHKLTKAEGQLDLKQPAALLARKIQAFDPWPVASVGVGEERLRLFGASVAECESQAAAGQVLELDARGVLIATGAGAIRVRELQWPGRKRLPAAQALQGRDISVGSRIEI